MYYLLEKYEWFLTHYYYNPSQEETSQMVYHPVNPNFIVLVSLINLWLIKKKNLWLKETCAIRKLHQSEIWPWQKLSSLGKLLLKAASPQLGNIIFQI